MRLLIRLAIITFHTELILQVLLAKVYMQVLMNLEITRHLFLITRFNQTKIPSRHYTSRMNKESHIIRGKCGAFVMDNKPMP